MSIATHWSTEKDGTHYRIDISIQNKSITIAEYTGHWKAEIGGTWSLEEFNEGKCDEYVFYGFDQKVLDQVYQSVKEVLESESFKSGSNS